MLNDHQVQMMYRLSWAAARKKWKGVIHGWSREDVVQEAMVNMLRWPPNGFDDERIGLVISQRVTWTISGIWKRIRHSNQIRRQPEKRFSEIDPNWLDGRTAPGSFFRDADTSDLIRRATQGLSRVQLLILILGIGEEMCLSEIARTIGMTEEHICHYEKHLRDQFEIAKPALRYATLAGGRLGSNRVIGGE